MVCGRTAMSFCRTSADSPLIAGTEADALTDVLGGMVLDMHTALIGGAAIDATGDPLPEATLTACRAAGAVVLGE